MDKKVRAAKKKIAKFWKDEDFKSIVDYCQSLISEEGIESEEIYLYLGVSQKKTDDFGGAVSSYEAALALNPDNEKALRGLAEVLREQDPGIDEYRAGVYGKLLSRLPEVKEATFYHEALFKWHWKRQNLETCQEHLAKLSESQRSDLVKRYCTLRRSLTLDQTRLLEPLISDHEVETRIEFYHTKASLVNAAGEDPSTIVTEQLLPLIINEESGEGSVSAGSAGSKTSDYGCAVTPGAPGYHASLVLEGLLWSVWSRVGEWTGSPNFTLPEADLETLTKVKDMLGRDTCQSKTTVNLLSMPTRERASAVAECVTCARRFCTIHRSAGQLFLGMVACAQLRESVDKVQLGISELMAVLESKSTFESKTLLRLLRRFQQYCSFTFDPPRELKESRDQILSRDHVGDDNILLAWYLLRNQSEEIIANEEPGALMEVARQYVISLSAEDRHVNVDLLLRTRQENPTDILINTLTCQVVRVLEDQGEFESSQYGKLLEECYRVDPRSPLLNEYLGDLHKEDRRPVEQVVQYYSQAMQYKPSPALLSKLETLNREQPCVRKALVEALQRLTKVEKNYMYYVKLALILSTPDDVIHRGSVTSLNPETLLKTALQHCTSDPLVYELLGDQYLANGRYKSAYNQLSRALSLAPTRYRAARAGECLLMLGYQDPKFLTAAIDHFAEWSESGSDPDILLGLVRGLAQEMGALWRAGNFPRAAATVARCLPVLGRLVVAAPRWVAPWKYLGDLLLQVSGLAELDLTLPPELATLMGLTEPTLANSEAAVLAAVAAYKVALSRAPEVSELVVDLARAYLDLPPSTYTLHALTLSRRAVTLRPRDPLAWNCLGCAAFRAGHHALAQHAYIAALRASPRGEDNPTTWTNLGVLYLRVGEDLLANQCFTLAQSQDPDYPAAWLGQHVVAGKLGCVEESEKLLSDIVRDCSREGTVEGTLAFALRALHGSADLRGGGESRDHLRGGRDLDPREAELLHELASLLARAAPVSHPSRWAVLNCAGVLHERLSLHATALSYYSRALKLLGEEREVERAGLRTNMERIRCKAGEWGEIPRTSMTVWSAVARMRSGELGAASAILDTLEALGEDVAVFQAALAWLSADLPTARSFLDGRVESAPGRLIQALICPEVEVEGVNDGDDAAVECLRLVREAEEKWTSSPDALYTRAKFLHHTKAGPAAREILLSLFERAHFFEDAYDLVLECAGEEEEKETDHGVMVQRAVHMFPWRSQLWDRLVRA